MANFVHKIVLTDGFRDHKMVMTFEVTRPDAETIAATMNSFAKGIVEPEESQILVNADTVECSIESGRVYFWFNDWLLDIYAEEV